MRRGGLGGHERALPERAIFLVAERVKDGVLLGFQSLEPFATYTQAFAHVGVVGTYVDLGCRRQGVGGLLFQATSGRANQGVREAS